MTTPPVIAAVLVTHNSQRYLDQTLASIDEQGVPPHIRIAIDDFSSDHTQAALRAHGFSVYLATSSAEDPTARIAQNFQQGLRVAVQAGAEVVILGDHDDIWHKDRIEHQSRLLLDRPGIALLASDGFLIDEHGAGVSGTIRTTFPVPDDFVTRSLGSQLAYAARHSLATGGACALRPKAMADWTVPAGWLHDRWWSLAALRARALSIDTTAVIDYRLSPVQQVGLDRADQHEPRRWTIRKLKDTRTTAAKLRDSFRLVIRKISQPTSIV